MANNKRVEVTMHDTDAVMQNQRSILANNNVAIVSYSE